MIDHAHCGENEEIFYQEAKSIIYKILDGKANPSQKDELMKSCHYILTKYTGELVNFLTEKKSNESKLSILQYCKYTKSKAMHKFNIC